MAGCALLLATGVAFCFWMFVSSRNGDSSEAIGEKLHYIWIEACRPVSIRQPLEVVNIGDNGEKGLYCALGGGVATDDDGGDAMYRFHIPTAGRYRLWGYCRWLDAEGDGFIVDIGGDQSIVRKSKTSSQWQWLPLAERPLPAGIERLTLKTKGGGFAVRRMFLSNDLTNHPSQCDIKPIDYFFDDFDGCEEGEFDSWNRVSGEWTVHRREDHKSPAAKLLMGKSSSEALIGVGASTWRDYSLTLDCRTLHASPGAMAAVRFCRDPEGNGLVLRWNPTDKNGQTQLELLHEDIAAVKMLDRISVDWDTSIWSELSVRIRNGAVDISINSLPVRTIPYHGSRKGAIGLWLSGDVEMMFDNVQVIGLRDRTSAAATKTIQSGNHQDRDDKEDSAHDEEEH